MGEPARRYTDEERVEWWALNRHRFERLDHEDPMPRTAGVVLEPKAGRGKPLRLGRGHPIRITEKP